MNEYSSHRTRVHEPLTTDRLIARVPMRQHDSEILQEDPSASFLSSESRASMRAPRRLGRASLPPRPRTLDRRWWTRDTTVEHRRRCRQSRVVSRVV